VILRRLAVHQTPARCRYRGSSGPSPPNRSGTRRQRRGRGRRDSMRMGPLHDLAQLLDRAVESARRGPRGSTRFCSRAIRKRSLASSSVAVIGFLDEHVGPRLEELARRPAKCCSVGTATVAKSICPASLAVIAIGALPRRERPPAPPWRNRSPPPRPAPLPRSRPGPGCGTGPCCPGADPPRPGSWARRSGSRDPLFHRFPPRSWPPRARAGNDPPRLGPSPRTRRDAPPGGGSPSSGPHPLDRGAGRDPGAVRAAGRRSALAAARRRRSLRGACPPRWTARATAGAPSAMTKGGTSLGHLGAATDVGVGADAAETGGCR